DEAVVRLELDLAAAHAHVQAPALGRRPFGLQVHVVGGHPVALVAAQRADNADVVAGEVFETQPVLVRHFVVEPGGQRERPTGQLGGPTPAAVDAVVVAVQVDRAAVVQGVVALHRHRHGQHLGGGAVAGPGGDRDLVAGRQRVYHAGAELVLPDRLAGIERERAVARRAAVVP